MTLNMIAAIDDDHGLGKDGAIPWPRLSKDLAFFRKMTVGGAVVMGRKTWDSLPKQPLPDRFNIVLSRQGLPCRGAAVVADVPSALDLARGHNATFVIGGAEVYRAMLSYCDKIYLTRVKGSYDCDVTFPFATVFEEFASDTLVHHPAEEATPAFRIEVWTRK